MGVGRLAWCAAVLLTVLSSTSEARRLVKRDTFAFSQSYYIFCITGLTPGTIIGTLTTTSTTPVTWQVTSPNNNIAIGVNTGQMILINYILANSTQVIPTTATNAANVTITTNVLLTNCSSTATTVASTIGIPVFPVSSYSLSTSGCTLGTLLATITASSSTGLSTTYAVVGATSYFYVAPTTGQLYLTGTTATTTTSFTIQATNSAGSTSIPVTVTTGCTAGTTTAATITTTKITTTAAASTYPLFGQTSYTFTNAAGAGGSLIDQVFASSPGATVTYSTTSTQFVVSSTSGLISVGATSLAVGTYTLPVTATDSSGKTKTITVTVVVTSTGAAAATTVASATTAAGAIPPGVDL